MSDASVYPGINPRANVNSFPSDELKIINNISRFFYITTGRKDITIGQSVYRYFFIKFPDSKTKIFGVHNEIIVLFSQFDSFEPRTLDAIEIIQRKHEGFRLDKICAFVISKDNDFIAKVDRLIKSQSESRIITPFTYSELAYQNNDDFYRDRIKKYFFERNLFDFDSPLRKDLYFFGREDVCQSLIDKHFSGQNGALFGLRRSGKTSILLSVCRRMADLKGIAVLIDCEQLHLMRWWDALYFIASRLNDEQHCRIALNKDLYTEFNASIEFDSFIKKAQKKLNKNILIILDEIEQITFDVSFSDHWRSGFDYVKFWHVLRSIFQMQHNPLTLIIAGTNPRCLETPFIKGGDIIFIHGHIH